MMRKIRHATFILIEMLVVLAIIAVLAALLMPGLRNALDSARLISCSDNIKQIGIARMQSCNDNNGNMPAYKSSSADGNHARVCGFANWPLEKMLASYMDVPTPPDWQSSRTGLFICPSSGTVMKSNGGYYYPGNSGYRSENNYSGLFFHYKNGLWNGTNSRLLNGSAFISPARSPYHYCSRNGAPAESMINGWDTNFITAPSWHGNSKTPPRPTIFMDGHAKVLHDLYYTVGQNDIPNDKDALRLIAKGGNPLITKPDIYLEEY